MEQCAQYLETAQPHLKIHRARGTDGLGPALDAARGGSGHLLCLLDARGSGADGGFWESLGEVLAERPWARCVVASYEGPPRDGTSSPHGSLAATREPGESVLARAVTLYEKDLAFDADERAAIRDLLSGDGLLNDLLLSEDRELGCPYLIGQHIERMAAGRATGVWRTTDLRIELRLLNLFDQALKDGGLAQYTIGRALSAARNYRAFSADLVLDEAVSSDQVAALIDRAEAVPLFDKDTDDETQTDQCAWRQDVWRAIAEPETKEQRRIRLENGLEGVRMSGGIAAPLYYLLELDRIPDAENLVRRNFRWMLIFCDRWATEVLEAVDIDPERAPALALLQIELRLRSEGFDLALRTKADAAFRSLRQWKAKSAVEEIERSGLLAFGATLSGRRDVATRYVDHLLELIEEVSAGAGASVDDAVRVKIVGACYLAYWAALQGDRHDEALGLATAMAHYSEPGDRLYLYERVSLVTEEDLHGLRSLSLTGDRPSSEWHSHAQPLIDLEEGKDAEALAFLRPTLSRDSRQSRSALDALVLLVRAVAAPEELSIREIERPLRLSREAWQDGRASSFLIWAAVVAFASIGARDEARAWVDSLAEPGGVFASLARMSLAYWDGSPEAATRASESVRQASPPRLAVCAWTFTAASHAVRGDGERAMLCLETAWRDHPAPRLFRFALRLIPQDAFESLLALADRLPRPIAQVFEDAREDGRAVLWVEYPKLTPSEQTILGMLWSGMSNKQIAESRVVAIGTVRTQLKALYRKLGASGRLEALAIANRFQLLDGNREDEEPG
jgi:DNA-binding CsgD family transcriptional regulator